MNSNYINVYKDLLEYKGSYYERQTYIIFKDEFLEKRIAEGKSAFKYAQYVGDYMCGDCKHVFYEKLPFEPTDGQLNVSFAPTNTMDLDYYEVQNGIEWIQLSGKSEIKPMTDDEFKVMIRESQKKKNRKLIWAPIASFTALLLANPYPAWALIVFVLIYQIAHRERQGL